MLVWDGYLTSHDDLLVMAGWRSETARPENLTTY